MATAAMILIVRAVEAGGPVLKQRAFLYGAYEFDSLGQQQISASGIAPTAAGLAALNALAAPTPRCEIFSRSFP